MTMARPGPDGKLKHWQPKHKAEDGTMTASATGRRDGGARKPGGSDGGVREWHPKANGTGGALRAWNGKGAEEPAAIASAPRGAAETPCVGCQGLQVRLVAGTREVLRTKLHASLVGFSSFLLGLFDAALVEVPPETQAVPSVETWEGRGFSVEAHDGALYVTSVVDGSLADQAGLIEGDRIVSVENAPRVHSLAMFAEKIGSTTFSKNKLIVDRHGAPVEIEVARP
jgi:hypothetical protein